MKDQKRVRTSITLAIMLDIPPAYYSCHAA
jgi:hypothetical protein